VSMVDPVRQLRRAWTLYRTDSRVDTYLAVGIVLLLLSPFIQVWWQHRRGD